MKIGNGYKNKGPKKANNGGAYGVAKGGYGAPTAIQNMLPGAYGAAVAPAPAPVQTPATEQPYYGAPAPAPGTTPAPAPAPAAGDTMSASYAVGFSTNLLERLYKDSDHTITADENASALNTDSQVASMSQAALNNPYLALTDDQKSAATSTQKLYEKKTNFDNTLNSVFANDPNGVNIADVRNVFGANFDRQVFGGLSLEEVIAKRTALQQAGDTKGVQDLDMWVHAQGSHEGDLVGADGKRIGAISILQNVDPATGQPIESKDDSKARGDAASAAAKPSNPTGALPSQQDFQNELNKELQGQVDQTFINSEVTGHKAKGDFIQNVLVTQLGASNLQSAAENNQTISTNAGQFLTDFNKISSNKPFISRSAGATFFNNGQAPPTVSAGTAAAGTSATAGSSSTAGTAGTATPAATAGTASPAPAAVGNSGASLNSGSFASILNMFQSLLSQFAKLLQTAGR